MENAWNFFYVNAALLIGSALIMLVGGLIGGYGKSSSLKSFLGLLVFTIGALAALQSFYFTELRWINGLLSVVMVIVFGAALIRNTPGVIATGAGVVIVVLAIITLSGTYPVNRIEVDTDIGESFSRGFNEMLDILRLGDDAPSRPRNRG